MSIRICNPRKPKTAEMGIANANLDAAELQIRQNIGHGFGRTSEAVREEANL